MTVSIKEGQRFRVGKLDIKGDDTADVAALHEQLSLKEGEIFNRSFLTEDVARLTEYYADRGFYFANVTPLSNLSASTEIVDVVFQVRKGPLYFVRNIDVSGNTLTVDDVVRREIPIVEGQLYSQRAVMLARGRIERLGFFEEVDLRMEPTDDPEQLDMNVSVVERPTGSFSFGAGYSSQDGIVVTGSLAQANLFGRGYNTQFSADVGGQTQRFYLSLQDPYVFGSEFSLGGTLFRTDLRYEDFDQTQTGAEVVLGHSLSEDGRTRGPAPLQLRCPQDQRGQQRARRGRHPARAGRRRHHHEPGRALAGLGHAQRSPVSDRGVSARRYDRSSRGWDSSRSSRAWRRGPPTTSAPRAGCRSGRPSWWARASAGRCPST